MYIIVRLCLDRVCYYDYYVMICKINQKRNFIKKKTETLFTNGNFIQKRYLFDITITFFMLDTVYFMITSTWLLENCFCRSCTKTKLHQEEVAPKTHRAKYYRYQRYHTFSISRYRDITIWNQFSISIH